MSEAKEVLVEVEEPVQQQGGFGGQVAALGRHGRSGR